MAFEMRRNGNAYLYRKVRTGGRVVSEYVGRGEFARLMYSVDRLTREREGAERAQARGQAQAERAAERDAWGLLAQAEQLAALAMLAAGFHRHRGQWRRRRAPPMANRLEEQARAELARRRKAAAALPPLPPPGDYSAEAIKVIMRRADRADATVEDVAALRALMRERGDRLTGEHDPLRQALERELHDMPATPLGRELVNADMEKRRAALGYAQAPALERPLINHLLLCELRLGNVEQSYTYVTRQNMTIDQGRYWEGKLSAAQARYLRAAEALARVRRVRVELARVLPDGTAEAVAVEHPGA